ncbi:hypothetical protein DIKCMJMK_01145 [Shewanella oneidensis]|nr:hypothetical protein [Shewanella oneidensis]
MARGKAAPMNCYLYSTKALLHITADGRLLGDSCTSRAVQIDG